MNRNNRSVASAVLQLLMLAAIVLLYLLIVTRGRPMDWLP